MNGIGTPSGFDRAFRQRLAGAERGDDPPRLVHAIDRGAEPHRRFDHLAGVAGVRVGPLPRVRLGLPALAHLAVARKAARVDQHAVAGLDAHLATVACRDDAHDAAVLDDEIPHGHLGRIGSCSRNAICSMRPWIAAPLPRTSRPSSLFLSMRQTRRIAIFLPAAVFFARNSVGIILGARAAARCRDTSRASTSIRRAR